MVRLAGLRRGFPTFRRIASPFRWVVRSRRRAWCLALALLAMGAAPPLWWAAQLIGLPDVGDPFDVGAFRAETIPDDRNAFTLYRQAADQYRPLSREDTSANTPIHRHTEWPTATPEVRRWAEANRDALALFRRGAERPDALDPSLTTTGGFGEFDALRPFVRLALLEASRLEGQGDMAGAWGWYRVVLRTIHHVGSRGRLYRRMNAQQWHGEMRGRVALWAADARTTPEAMRRALDDAVACGAVVPSESYALQVAYLHMDRMFGEWMARPGHAMPPPWLEGLASRGAAGLPLAPEQVQSIADAWRAWRREPERSRRVFRLLTANRLAFHDLPPDRRPSPDPGVSSCDLYALGPGAPAGARALSPGALGRWLDSTQDPRMLIGSLESGRLRTLELENHRELVILLGTGLYRRDRGADPPTPEALVGPYVESLPAGPADQE